jgi:recombination protein RecA
MLKLADAEAERLRKLVAPAPVAAPLATGHDRLDSILGGGLPRGRLAEVSGAWSSGKTALLLRAAARATGRKQLCAYIDGPGELYPPAAAALDVDLDRLLVVRPGTTREATRAAEIVARSGAFPLVILDLPHDARVDESAAGRLRAAAAAHGAAIVALTLRPGALAQAVLKLEVAAEIVTLRKGGQAPPGTQVKLTRAFHDEDAPALAGDLVLRRRA